MDIDVVEKAIKAFLEETLKRTRLADEELKKAEQGGAAWGTRSWRRPWRSTPGAWTSCPTT